MFFPSDLACMGVCCTGTGAADIGERELAVDSLVVGAETANAPASRKLCLSTAGDEAAARTLDCGAEYEGEVEGPPAVVASPLAGAPEPVPNSPVAGSPVADSPAAGKVVALGRSGKEDLAKNLQEETMCSIMGYTGQAGPAPRGPMLLGRTNLAAVASSKEEVKGGGAGSSDADGRASSVQKKKALRTFLLSSGFAHADEQKMTKGGLFRKGFTFPLHAAVTINDAEVVEMLLTAGADRTHMDSQRLTPLALARQLNERGSHEKVIALLEG
mmetsp:Transcript_49462/g.142281  ORF Transcript_49462/g.142281 Transcript_49462/m.142281 type:complete len:272 (-) Transcript_49462:90-905(-)|eukprot:CAMPEP_0176116258 /NCGR_PEP_ID=MMETSP0120_2-20121206/58391_1 /TAXON_ID=160619 /ORGANISM="Kryptoperidinium foliaceum, Strain CCMP 1326" /LENGTH=271 /DNA_ID=CAMNT_0017450515 /DNA_START=65 /DNA_END=880 /DNA_ORIENTATION=-